MTNLKHEWIYPDAPSPRQCRWCGRSEYELSQVGGCEARVARSGTYRVTRHHGGDTISEHDTEESAIAVAKAEAKRTGQRHDVYPRPTGQRIVSCYPYAMLWERDIAHLPGGEYVRRHQEADLVGRK